jgi:hypothetical protein
MPPKPTRRPLLATTTGACLMPRSCRGGRPAGSWRKKLKARPAAAGANVSRPVVHCSPAHRRILVKAVCKRPLPSSQPVIISASLARTRPLPALPPLTRALPRRRRRPARQHPRLHALSRHLELGGHRPRLQRHQHQERGQADRLALLLELHHPRLLVCHRPRQRRRLRLLRPRPRQHGLRDWHRRRR